MAQLAIKGHPTRGAEVIALLEMLGGKNTTNLHGECDNMIYIINSSYYGEIITQHRTDGYVVFSLEEFLERFPYKVGDKVIIKVKNQEAIIDKVVWCCDTITYWLKYDGCLEGNWRAKNLQPYKEETMEEKIQAYEITGEFRANEVAIEFDPSKFEMIERNGKYFVVKKQPQYPKTYKECCEVLRIPKNEHYIDIDAPLVPSDYNRLVSAFTKLLICRDAYWKIAGEEMGLGKPWQPDYHEKSYEQGSPIKYVIYYTGTHITKEQKCTPSYILAFPTEEMRNAFFDNFKELIEECKELL